jgi:hypothetical protein
MPSVVGTASSVFTFQDAFGGGSLLGTVNAGGYGLFFSSEGHPSHDVALRLAGHALVAFMPPAGLAETIETLSDYFEFHVGPKLALARGEEANVVTGTVTSRTVARAPILEEQG